MRKTLALATATLVASSVGALAQNNDERCFDKGTLTYYECPKPEPVAAAPPPAPVPPPPPLWTGAYVGAHAGYAWGDFDGTYTGLGTPLDYGALDADGPLVGGQIGYNHQFDNNLVLGVEGDFSWLFNADDSASNTGLGPVFGAGVVTFNNGISADLDWLASARVRAGYAADNVMPYITGGVAMAGYEIGASSSATTGFSTTGRTDETAIGGVVGGGIEYLASENIVLRAEGLYYMFDDDEGIAGLTTASGAGDKAGLEDVIVGRIGLSYKF